MHGVCQEVKSSLYRNTRCNQKYKWFSSCNGHEIAHAVAKHSVERASRGALINTGTQLIDIFSGGNYPGK